MTKVSGYTTLHRAQELGYPYERTLRSLARVCDEVVALVTNESDDFIIAQIASLELPQVRVVRKPLPPIPGWDGKLKHLASRECKGDVLIQMDSDEEFHPHSYPQVRAICQAKWETKCLSSLQFNCRGPVLGHIDTKWRFFKNDYTWKHGIPTWDLGPGGTAKSTDGCFPYLMANDEVLPLIVPDWAEFGFWPLVIHTGGRDMFKKLKRHGQVADAWDRLRGGKAFEATGFGEVRGKTDEELRVLADAWVAANTKDCIPLPNLF
jgi:hypothetical protein